MNTAHTVRSFLLASILSTSAACASPTLIVSQGTTMYRYSNGATQSYLVSDVISGMTNVPVGMTVGTLNGGASGGDILAVSNTAVYRVDNALTTPTLTQIGVPGGVNASPVFVGGRLFGIGGLLPYGSVVTEWNSTNFNQINVWPTGVFGGPGGMVGVPGTLDEFYYSEFNTDAIYHYKLGDTFSTYVCSTPNNDYVGLELVGNTIYASYALPGTGQFVLGTQALNGTFTQLVVLDTYQSGITGLAQIVPAPGSAAVLSLGGLFARRRRR
jgi:hypothetical protein